MLITPHVLVGAAIGVSTSNPVLAFAGGLVSHFLMDIMPHFDPGTFHKGEKPPLKIDSRDLTIGVLDSALAFFLILWLAGAAPIVALAPAMGILGGVLPDVVGLSPLAFPKVYNLPGLHQYFKFTEKYHFTVKPSQIWLGILTQIIVSAGALWILVG